jgi:hypothetical protein
MYLINYIIALFLTIVIELCVALAFGYKEKKALYLVVLVNLLTHPVINYIIFVNSIFSLMPYQPLVIILEIIVVIVEWQALSYGLNSKKIKLFYLSLYMNAVSYGIGLLLGKIIIL